MKTSLQTLGCAQRISLLIERHYAIHFLSLSLGWHVGPEQVRIR